LMDAPLLAGANYLYAPGGPLCEGRHVAWLYNLGTSRWYCWTCGRDFGPPVAEPTVDRTPVRTSGRRV
jgi:hypothetical protein